MAKRLKDKVDMHDLAANEPECLVRVRYKGSPWLKQAGRETGHFTAEAQDIPDLVQMLESTGHGVVVMEDLSVITVNFCSDHNP